MLKRITFLLLLLLLLFIPTILLSQENIFYHFGIDDGLSQESVQCLIKDSSGFIWLGTQEGLNRFDGHSFKVYKNDFNIQNSICGNDVEELLEYEGSIFIGTKNNGVCYYDKSLNVFLKTEIKEGTCTGLVKHNQVIYIAILNEGLYKVESIDDVFVITKVPFFNSKTITSLYSNGTTLFVGTSKGMMYYSSVSDNKHFNEVKIVSKTATVNTFYFDNNNIWIGTSVGLYKFNLKDNSLALINLKNNYKISKNINVNKIIKNNSNFYIASDNGLFLLSDFDANSNNFNNCIIYKGDKDNVNSITSNRVYDLLLHNNILWVGSNKLDVLSLKKPVFKSIITKGKPKISNNHIYATYKTDDYLFVGTRNGLNCIDNEGKTTVILKSNSKIAGNVIRAITKDSNNNLWLATTKGVSIINLTGFDSQKPIIKSIYHKNNDLESLSNNDTRSVFEDNFNNIWIATFGGGINLFTGDLSTNNITFKYFKANPNQNSISSDFTFNINQTADNSYWISTESGFNKLVFNDVAFKDYTFTNYKKDLKDSNALKSEGILTTFIDKKDNNILWIGTENGLQKLDLEEDNFTYYGAKNGLKNSVVYAILEDSSSNLWVSTNSGLFRFDKTDERFINYTVNDGLKNVEYNLGSEFYDYENKKLYFGGTNGLDYFSINDLERLNHSGNLFFTSLYVKEKEINPSDEILPKSIINTKEIYLKHNDFPAKLTFADLNFDFPISSEFVYKLLPNDKDWNPLKTQKEIQLLNLNSGTYKLLIQGKGKKNLWNQEPLQLTIVVSPPWYQSVLAYFIYVLLFLGSVLYLYKFQLNRSLERKETARLKELNELKTKLYSNITHEFRTPLTVILGITDSISENINATPNKIKNYLDMIKRNSNNLLQLVNQILDLSKVEKGKVVLNLERGDIVKHIKYLTESFSSYAEEKKISLIFYNEINKLSIPFDKDKINKIISNLLSNAIKFSKENSKIIVYLKQQKENLIIEVKDNGLGISKENLPFIFDRFYQADNNIGTSGTGIGLALTKELVELIKGTIKAESKENVETIFTVTLPIVDAEEVVTTISKVVKINCEVILDADKQIALIVEDNDDVRTYIKLCIEKDYIVIEAKNGKEGIELAFEHTPDIIISDVMMPLVDGFELCKTLKEDIKTNHIPIILLTAKNSQESKIEGLIQGADAYLTKPFNKEELLIRIQKLIDVRELLQSKYKDIESINLNDELTDKNNVFLQKVIALIRENLEDSEYHSKNLAEDMFLSESQLYRKLKAVTTYSTAIFIRKIKLQTAKKLLETTDKNIAEICYETGFSNPSWFARTFKKEFGFSPSDVEK